MSDIYCCLIDRRDFGDLLSVHGLDRLNLKSMPDVESLLQRPTRDQSVLAVWSQKPGTGNPLPNLLVCGDGTESDWAAWITTFAAKVRPFSAFMRLITRSEFGNIAKNTQKPTLARFSWAAVGLIIGEVLAASRMPDKSLDTLPMNAFESTLSFAMFRASALNSDFRRWSELVKAWETTRQVTRQHQRLIEGEAVARVCATIIEAAGLGNAQALLRQQDIEVVQACREIVNSADLATLSLSTIPHFASIRERMRGPREDRVVALSEFVRDIEESPSGNRELISFALGFLASQIAPGTIQHSAVLDSVARRYTTAMLWYGFFGGLGESKANSTNVADATRPILDLPVSAKWVARNLLRPETILMTPNCDVAFFELVALSRSGDDPLFSLMRTAQGTATIELMPGIWTVVNVSPRLGTGEALSSAREKEILAAMGEYLDRLRGAYNDLVGSDIGEPRQRSLFQQKRKRP